MSPRSWFGIAITGYPCRSSSASVADQLLESAKAPWTKAMVGLLLMSDPFRRE